ncbi:hypothetical protein [uncultured Clostridium sp.]|jgi:secreted PhoX family phosphatase|uniref:hypothetical protein n=1 Tax=uncultured Clostridium sp. TaxID=59620 RepID=UPI0026093CBE|nr:hypothetical protein [uncultured Clostridium sp.]
MNTEQFKIAIEEFLAYEVIRRGKLLSGTDSSAVRIIIEKMCMNCCGGTWDFGTYFFIDESIRVYFRFTDKQNNIKEVAKYIFSKSEIEDFVFKYLGNELNIIKRDARSEDIIPEKNIVKTKKKKEIEIEQMSLF